MQRLNGKRIKAIIFDVSGTLMDDIQSVWRANADAYKAFGIYSFDTLKEFREKFKLPVQDFHRESGVPAHLINEVDLKFREVYPGYATLIRIFPDVIDALTEMQKRQVLLGVASNIPTPFLREHMRHFAIERYFTTIIGQDDCDEQKPSPKPILTALARLGVAPGEAMYVGDMEEDLIAAKAAKTTATAIVRDEGYHPRWRLERQNPDLFISSLAELIFD